MEAGCEIRLKKHEIDFLKKFRQLDERGKIMVTSELEFQYEWAPSKIKIIERRDNVIFVGVNRGGICDETSGSK